MGQDNRTHIRSFGGGHTYCLTLTVVSGGSVTANLTAQNHKIMRTKLKKKMQSVPGWSGLSRADILNPW